MGYYINPPDNSKEEFLATYGTQVPSTFRWTDTPENSLPVVLMDNGLFTSAGIAYSAGELAAFTRPDDPRPRRIYTVPITALAALGDQDINTLLEECHAFRRKP